MELNPYIVTINGRHRVRVFAYDAQGAASRGDTVYRYTVANPEPCASINAEADLRSANIEAEPVGYSPARFKAIEGGAR
jgi:hypothetical protein